MSESIPAEAIEAKKTEFIGKAKQSILARLRPIIEYKVRNKIAPESITEEMELNQYYVDEALNEHEASGKKNPYISFSEFAAKQGGGK